MHTSAAHSRGVGFERRLAWLGLALGLILDGRGAPGADALVANPEERQRIEQAIPTRAVAPPLQPRTLLIFDRNVGYGGHPSAKHAAYACTLMGQKTGAFATVISGDPEVFRRESLERFDAVFFNNNVGNLFTDAELRQNLVEFVTGGGGLLGVHGTTVAFTQWPGAREDWPEFGVMIGARGANHRENTEHVFIKLDDPDHPLNAVFGGQGWEFRDEFFRVGDPYSRNRVRVLFSIDTAKTDLRQGRAFGQLERADNDFALAWVRSYGRGRVFYCTIAHNPYVFWDRRMLEFYLGAIQFALGDLPAPTMPSAQLTPARRAQERLGWRLGLEAYTLHKLTFFEAIEKTAQLGLSYIGGLSFQKVSADLPKNFAPVLSDDELRTIRLKLDAAGLRLLTFYIQEIPGDEAECRKVFEFGRKLGIETFMTEPKLEALDTIERLANAYGINVALHNHDPKASPHYWSPAAILKVCAGRSPRLGAAADLGYWMRAGIDPVEGIRALKERLITLQMHDLHERSPSGHDVPWGTGQGRSAGIFQELQRLRLKPTMIGLEHSRDFDDNLAACAQSAAFFDRWTLAVAP
ncbi:MAG: TIM barrel protein [Verrucomicrobia bacterium]|nr:TIM barrel protein [Verrucomicrobiota bacterium]